MNRNHAMGKRFEFDNVYFEKPVSLGFIDLYQIGELYCEPGYQINEHNQKVFEISYIVSGEGTFTTNGVDYHVKANQIYINSINELHAINVNKGVPLRFFYLGFDFNEKHLNDDILKLKEFYSNISFPVLKDGKNLTEPFINILYELYDKRALSLEMIDAYICQIIVSTYRMSTATARHPNFCVNSDDSSGSIVYSVVRYIDENFRNITKCADISKMLGYSYTYLAHKFKEKMGMTIGNYIIQKKIDEAKSLLTIRRMNMTQVSDNLNYLSVQAFSNSFKKVVGISPSEYIKSHSHKP